MPPHARHTPVNLAKHIHRAAAAHKGIKLAIAAHVAAETKVRQELDAKMTASAGVVSPTQAKRA
jgi:hypothetical protein